MELVRNKKNGSLYYIFEYIDSDLSRVLKAHHNGLPEPRAVDLTQQMLEGLGYMHNTNFIHRDLKPENILYHTDSETLRIADLGTARSLRARPPFTEYVGTRWYRAPECLLRDCVYSSPVDMWAVGLIFGELLRGTAMFPGTSTLDQLYKIFQVFGQPGADWPEFTRLADAARFKGPKQQGCGLQRVVPRASPLALGVIGELLSLNPRRRSPAKRALESPLFSQLPRNRAASMAETEAGGEKTPPPLSPRSVVGDDGEPARRPPSVARPSSSAHPSSVARPASEVSEILPTPKAAANNAGLDIDLDDALDAILGGTGRPSPPLRASSKETVAIPVDSVASDLDADGKDGRSFPFEPDQRPDSENGSPACGPLANPALGSSTPSTMASGEPYRAPTRAVEPSVDDLLDDLLGVGMDDPSSPVPKRSAKPVCESRPPLPVPEPPAQLVLPQVGSGETRGSGLATSAWDLPVARQSPRPGPLPDSAVRQGRFSLTPFDASSQPPALPGIGTSVPSDPPAPRSRGDDADEAAVPRVDGGQWSDSDADAEAEPERAPGLGTTALGASNASFLRQAMADADGPPTSSKVTRIEPASDTTPTAAAQRRQPRAATEFSEESSEKPALVPPPRPSENRIDRVQSAGALLRAGLSSKRLEPIQQSDLSRPGGLRGLSEQAPLARSRRSIQPEQPWDAEESTRLRQIVKRVVRAGTRDKEDLWERVTAELGTGRSPKDCRLRYKNEYKVHKAKATHGDELLE